MKSVLAFLLCVPVPVPVPSPRHVYDNEDLARVSSRRSETGVDSHPESVAVSPIVTEPSRGRGEAYWRREAEHVRRAVVRLRDQVASLKLRLEEVHRKEADKARSGGGGGRGSRGRSSTRNTGGSTATLEGRLQVLERRLRDEESSLADRARRDGALPGWLR